jgi:hypothetical protein
MNWLRSASPEHALSFFVFIVGVTAITWVSLKYAAIFHRAAEKDPSAAVKEAGITFVSGHFLAFFLLPFALLVGACLALVGKLDAGIAAIVGMIVGYIANKVAIR